MASNLPPGCTQYEIDRFYGDWKDIEQAENDAYDRYMDDLNHERRDEGRGSWHR